MKTKLLACYSEWFKQIVYIEQKNVIRFLYFNMKYKDWQFWFHNARASVSFKAFLPFITRWEKQGQENLEALKMSTFSLIKYGFVLSRWFVVERKSEFSLNHASSLRYPGIFANCLRGRQQISERHLMTEANRKGCGSLCLSVELPS